MKAPLQIAWWSARRWGSVSGFQPRQSVPYSLTKKGFRYFSKNRAVFSGHHARGVLLVVGVVLGEVHLRERVEVRPLAAAGEARGDEVAQRVDGPQVATLLAVPGHHVLVLQVAVLVVDLVEELPGEQVGERAPAGHQVAEALLVDLPGLRAGEEVVLGGARPAVRRVVGAARPEVVPAPEVWLHLEDAVVVEAEHDEDAAALGLRQDPVEAPGGVEAVAGPVAPVPLDPERLAHIQSRM